MRDLAHRLAGAALLLASGATTYVHRVLYAVSRQAPPGAAEMALGLATFMLASAGILLLIHGATLFARRKPARRAPATPIDRTMAPVASAGRAVDARRGVAVAQSRQKIAALRAERLIHSIDAGHG